VHSPAGGQGMNTGLVDAAVLGQSLASVIKGERPDSALDEYHRSRRAAATEVLSLAGRLTALATMQGTLKRAIRNTLLSLANIFPPAKQRLVMNLSGLSRRAMALHPQ
jgi:2-polyprenyl-6-methoxyphenol hydroxylase-like FAD-dependent oxidoreductase